MKYRRTDVLGGGGVWGCFLLTQDDVVIAPSSPPPPSPYAAPGFNVTVRRVVAAKGFFSCELGKSFFSPSYDDVHVTGIEDMVQLMSDFLPLSLRTKADSFRRYKTCFIVLGICSLPQNSRWHRAPRPGKLA